MPAMQVEQNFEYRDEMLFRGEEMRNANANKLHSGIVADISKLAPQQQNMQANGKAQSMGMNSLMGSFQPNMASVHGNNLNQLQSRNNQQIIKSGFNKAVGVTSMVSEEKKQEQEKPKKPQTLEELRAQYLAQEAEGHNSTPESPPSSKSSK